jgi:3-dehydroquinate synthase
LIDPSVLQTLPPQEWKNGSAEMIKYGLIRSKSLFGKLLQGLSPKNLASSIEECCQIKNEVVAQDFHERGLRRILNFGHTVGHALELIEEYTLPHGEAVAIGMLAEGYISYKLGGLSKEEFSDLAAILDTYQFSLKVSPRVTKEKIKASMKLDKKAKGGSARFVVLRGIGDVMPFEEAYCSEITPALLDEMLDWILRRIL